MQLRPLCRLLKSLRRRLFSPSEQFGCELDRIESDRVLRQGTRLSRLMEDIGWLFVGEGVSELRVSRDEVRKSMKLHLN